GSQRLSEVPEEIFDAFHYQTDIEEKALDYSDFVSDDEDRRAQAYLDYYDKNIIGSELLASALEGEVIANNYITKLYGYEDPFTVYLEQDGIDIEEYETFHDEVKKGLVLLHRWKKIERQLRG
ncbi:oligoendopeptidase F family protein, partial [Aduncisulcus paluster]